MNSSSAAAAAAMNARGIAEEYDMHLKLLMLGDSGVGKTCLLLRYAYESFSPTFITTVGIDFKIKEFGPSSYRPLQVRLQIWDTAGQERFRTITISYFKGAHGILLVYDISDRETFENVSHWVHQIRENADDKVVLILVGNKCDREEARAVTKEEGEELARRFGVPFFETSAKANTNVDECYNAIARETKDALLRQAEASSEPQLALEKRGLGEKSRQRRSCCG